MDDIIEFDDGIYVESGDEFDDDDDGIVFLGEVSGNKSPDEENNNSSIKHEDGPPAAVTLNIDTNDRPPSVLSTLKASAHFVMGSSPGPSSSRNGSGPVIKSETRSLRSLEEGVEEKPAVKREVKVERNRRASSHRDEVDEHGRILRHVAFARHPIIGGKGAPTEPAIVGALLEEAPPLLRTFSLLLLHVKEQFLGLMWEGSEFSESKLKNMMDLRDRMEHILEELALDFEIVRKENEKDGNIVPSERHGMKTTLKIEGTQICSVRHGEMKRAIKNGARDVFVRFVQMGLRATHVKLVDSPKMLQMAYNANSLADSFRFDKLIASDELETTKSWEMIQSLLSMRLPRIRVPVEEAEDSFGEPRFGRYPGSRTIKSESGTNVKNEAGAGIRSRLGDLSMASSRNGAGSGRPRVKKEVVFSWDRKREEERRRKEISRHREESADREAGSHRRDSGTDSEDEDHRRGRVGSSRDDHQRHKRDSSRNSKGKERRDKKDHGRGGKKSSRSSGHRRE